MAQLRKIEQCIANRVCLISRRAKLGKPIKHDMCVLKKLWLVWKLYQSEGYSCDITCFLTKNCNC